MSIIIQTIGGANNTPYPDETSTNTDSPSGPEHFWAGLRLACPTVHLEKTVGVADGTSTLFSIGDVYEEGYLDVFLNGVKQRITTHYTETSPETGTFTFVSTPPANYQISAIYAKLCDSDLTFGSSTGLPARKPSAFPGLGPWQRVYTAGGGGTQGAKFAYTDNVYDTSPTWTAVNTGLPTTSGTRAVGSASETGLAVDPFNPSTTAMLACYTDTANSIVEIFRNTAIRTGGSWSSVFSVTTLNTLTGDVNTTMDLFEIYSTIAASGVYYATVLGDVSGNRIIHTHDNGANWTVSATFGSEIPGIAVGQRNALLVYVSVDDVGTGNQDARTNLADHHVWADSHAFATPSTTRWISIPLLPLDTEVYTLNDSLTQVSTNSADTFATHNSTPVLTNRLRFSPTAPDTAWILSTTGLRRSSDRYLTSAAITLPSVGSWRDGSLMGTDALCLVRSTTPFVYTTPDWANFTDRSGNISSTYQAAQGPRQVAHDWTS